MPPFDEKKVGQEDSWNKPEKFEEASPHNDKQETRCGSYCHRSHGNKVQEKCGKEERHSAVIARK